MDELFYGFVVHVSQSHLTDLVISYCINPKAIEDMFKALESQSHLTDLVISYHDVGSLHGNELARRNPT